MGSGSTRAAAQEKGICTAYLAREHENGYYSQKHLIQVSSSNKLVGGDTCCSSICIPQPALGFFPPPGRTIITAGCY